VHPDCPVFTSWNANFLKQNNKVTAMNTLVNRLLTLRVVDVMCRKVVTVREH
jgi:hypothetical protein